MTKLHFLKSVTNTINNSLIFQSEASVIVFDGGMVSEAEYLHDYLVALGGHVDAWFLTHAHNDHVCAICEILTKYDDVTVDKVCYRFPSDAWLDSNDKTGEGLRMACLLRQTFEAKAIPVDTVEAGDTYDFDGFGVRVLRVPDEAITGDPINNSSVVYRVEAGQRSVIVLGDLGMKGGEQLLENVDHTLIKADYCQMSHHGQNGVEREVYEVIRPSYCLWPTPSWLWDNMGKGGYDTGHFNTLVTRGWISAMHCVQKHYLMTEGTHVIDLDSEQ